MQYRVITLYMSEGAPARDIGSHKKIVKVLAVQAPNKGVAAGKVRRRLARQLKVSPDDLLTHQWAVTALVEDSSAEQGD